MSSAASGRLLLTASPTVQIRARLIHGPPLAGAKLSHATALARSTRPAWCFRLSQVAEDDERMQRGHQDDQYEVGRLLALSDGIFAVAMTLLVVSIPVPVLTHPT